jgi:SAM-dependent methyltransferase
MADSHIALDSPSPWVARFVPLVPDGEVLDLACGGGRHARLLAGFGRQVLAVDRDADALERAAGEGIRTLQADLENGAGGSPFWPFEADRFSGIVVTNYLHRPLLPHILSSLGPGGVLIYETFALGNERFGKPSNPDFLLQPAELLKAAGMASLHVLAFEDGYVDIPRPAMVQRICAVKPGFGPNPAFLRLG